MKISDLPSLDLSYGDKEDIISLQDNSWSFILQLEMCLFSLHLF